MFSLLPLLLAGFASAKDPCGALKQSDDPLNGPIATYSLPLGPYSGSGQGLELKWEKATWTLRLKPVANGMIPAKAGAGELARVAVGGQIVELSARAEAAPVFLGGLSTLWEVDYSVTAEQLATLASAPVTVIAQNVGGQEYRMPISDKGAERLQQVLTCATKLEP